MHDLMRQQREFSVLFPQMKQRLLKIFSLGTGLFITAAILWLGYEVVKNVFAYLNAIPKELAAALVAGVAAVVVSTVTVMVGRHFERKKELDALYREKKMEIYDEFLKKFFDLFYSSSESHPTPEPQDLVPFLREFTRKLILWSGPEPITAFLLWKEHLAQSTPDAQTMVLTERFLLTLRTDLRHSNRGIPQGFFATLVMKEGALLLALAKENPNITLAQVAEVEKLLKTNSPELRNKSE